MWYAFWYIVLGLATCALIRYRAHRRWLWPDYVIVLIFWWLFLIIMFLYDALTVYTEIRGKRR